MSLLARIEAERSRLLDRLASSVAVRAAFEFGYWPPRPHCGIHDPHGRPGPCLRPPGHPGFHSAVGCAAGC